jgi:HAE1 family hydrophobic/amphiphilic exporter-1
MEKSLTPIFIFAAAMLLTARGAPRWALRRPVLLAVLTAGFVAWSLWVLTKLPVELMPNASSETVTVSISVRGGMSPADVETLVVRPLEGILGDIPRLKSMFSSAKKDRGAVTLDFHSGVDMKRVTAEVNERVDRVISKLPPEIEKPVIAHFEENDSPIFIFAVTSPRLSPEQVRRLVDDRLKDRLLRAPGVANVEVGGGREGKILVELDRSRMMAYRLSPHQITSLIGRRNVAIQVGNVRGVTRVSPIRVGGQIRDLDDLRKVVVARDPSGGTVLLENVATVTDGYLEAESLSRLNGQAAVSVYVQKESSANTLKTSRAVRKALDSAWREGGLQREGLTRIVVSDQSQGIQSAIVSVRVSLLAGVLLILLALCVFESRHPSTKKAAVWLLSGLMGVMVVAALLKKGDAFLEPYLYALIGMYVLAAYSIPDVRAGLIVAGSMPLSALFCFLLFYACGISINVMSLFGLALGLGMLVDNATVVYENLSHRDLGSPGPVARSRALAGTEEMVVPLIGATVTNAVVFVPFLFLSKDIQNMFTDVAAAVGASLFASLGISLTVVPLLTVMVPREGTAPFLPKSLSSVTSLLNHWKRGTRPIFDTCGRCVVWASALFSSLESKIQIPSWWQKHSFLPLEMAGLFLVSFLGFWWAGGRGAAKVFFFLATAGATAVGFWALRDYRRWWPILIRHRRGVLTGVVVWALAAGLVLFKATERDFQMSGQADEFVIFVELSSGVKLDISNRVVADIEQVLASDLEVLGRETPTALLHV